MEKKPNIISIAGGKGGVGKSFIAANLAIALSELGKKIILIDLDLGGANLHSFLGLSNTNPGIGEFIKKKIKLSQFLINLHKKNLKFIPGDGITPFMGNISFLQKHKLIKNIENLEADYIILDLGAGSNFNILDFYNISNRGILISRPDFLSVISMLSFLKNALLRKISRVVKKNEVLKKLLNDIFKRPMENSITVKSIIEELSLVDKNISEEINEICKNNRPGIIFNMANDISELEIANQLNNGLESVLSIEADYFGFVYSNNEILNSIKEKIPFLNYNKVNITTIEIRQIAKRIVKYLNNPIKNSQVLLKESTVQLLDKWDKSEKNH